MDEIHAIFSFHSTFLKAFECERGTSGEKGALVDWQRGVTGLGRSSRSHCGRKNDQSCAGRGKVDAAHRTEQRLRRQLDQVLLDRPRPALFELRRRRKHVPPLRLAHLLSDEERDHVGERAVAGFGDMSLRKER